jgi:hypothetical protein
MRLSADAMNRETADAALQPNQEVTVMKTTHKLDQFEGTVRFGLGVALLLIAWDYGWTVIGTGAFVLGAISLATAFTGLSLVDRLSPGHKS